MLRVPKMLRPALQSRHAPWEPHTNRDEILFCILPYLNISDVSWLKVLYKRLAG